MAVRLVRPVSGHWLRSVWGFTMALMLVTLAMVGVVAEFGDQVDTARRAQIMLAELESDAADLQRALGEVMSPPLAAPGTLVEIADEREDLQENISELVGLVGKDDVGLADMRSALRQLDGALTEQLALARAGDVRQAEASLEKGMSEAFEGFDDTLGEVSDEYEAKSARLTEIGDVVLWLAVLLAWSAIAGLSWHLERGRRVARARIEASRERFRTLAEAAFEGVAVTRRGRVVEASDAFAAILGYGIEETTGLHVVDLVAPEFQELMRLSASEGSECQFEARAVRKDGGLVTVEIRTRPAEYRGETVQVTAIRDITERKALEEQLKHQALHDALTGLTNRTLFVDRLGHALTRTRGERPTSVAVLFLDLDEFKVVNDSLGHQAGDQLLTIAATRLRSCLRPQDTVARLGGDEFAVLLEDIADEEDAVAAAGRIAKVFKAHPAVLADDQQEFIAASIGIAFGTPGVHSPAQLLRDADLAMYEAKAQGKGRFAVFYPGLEVRARERMQLENDLRHAVEDGQFEVHYQPLVDMNDGSLRSVEALLRWHHPGRGLVPPAEFIAIAEQSGLIVPIGRWVLDQACRDVAGWQRTFPGAEDLNVSVNLSVHQLSHPSLVEEVTESLATHGPGRGAPDPGDHRERLARRHPDRVHRPRSAPGAGYPARHR